MSAVSRTLGLTSPNSATTDKPSFTEEGLLGSSRVITEAQAASFLSLSVPQLRRLRRQGKAPDHVQLSARRLGYQIDAVLAFLNARTIAGHSATQFNKAE